MSGKGISFFNKGRNEDFMVITKQTYLEFINQINPEQDQMKQMIKNTTINRQFFSVKINGQEWHGFRNRNQIKEL